MIQVQYSIHSISLNEIALFIQVILFTQSKQILYGPGLFFTPPLEPGISKATAPFNALCFTIQGVVYPGVFYDDKEDGYSINLNEDNVWIVAPHLNHNTPDNLLERQRLVVDNLFSNEKVDTYISWYYTPMSLLFTEHLQPALIVYDCMDELSAFKFADRKLKDAEQLLLRKADIVFTGGNSLYEAKKDQHANIHAFASSIDKDHFGIARDGLEEFGDQVNIPHPRLGFYGVIDERFDIELIRQAADRRPDWHFVLIGPVVKIDPGTLSHNSNIHYLGSKTYKELPAYLSSWDIALIPFAINESTRFISPTKTPEYLAAGKPVISTPITDVVEPYGRKGLVHIVHNATEFIEKAVLILEAREKKDWLAIVDDHLADNSWDNTWFRMHELIKKELYNKQHLRTEKKQAYV